MINEYDEAPNLDIQREINIDEDGNLFTLAEEVKGEIEERCESHENEGDK
jgi:hypothetical protein